MSIESLLGSKYNINNYIVFARDLLKDIRPVQKTMEVYSQYSEYISNCDFVADFTDNSRKKVAILSVKVTENSKARTIQRNYIAKLLSNGDLQGYDAALCAFYDDSHNNWKLALVTIDFNVTENGIGVEFQPAKRFSFLVGEGEPSKTYIAQLKTIFDNQQPPTFEKIREAFSINRVTEDFYNDYCECFIKLSDYLMQNEDFILEAAKLKYDSAKEFAIAFTKKTLGQIVFLHFIQKKGWLGVKKDDVWGQGNKNFIYESINYQYDNYFNDFLEPLFYTGLNKKRENDLYFSYEESKIPFLNGGLFSPIDNYDWENTNFQIPNTIWYNKKKDGFLDILCQYNFTVDENNPTEQDIAVDPEMLGRIFESLLDPELRYSRGAHYTPREVVEYMCQESLASKISLSLPIKYDEIKQYLIFGNNLIEKDNIIKNVGFIHKFLDDVKILDPAVGSGAFLVGMLNIIVKLKEELYFLENKNIDRYILKKYVIQNSLYGVDIEHDAIEIAKLRLWLSLIVDQEIINNNPPHPLPNLLYQLRVGNSLVDTFRGVKLWDYRWKSNEKNKRDGEIYNIWGIMDSTTVDYKIRVAKEKFFDTTDEKEKNALINQISKLQMEKIKDYVLYNESSEFFYEIVDMEKKRTKPFFIWEIEFFDIIEKGGFDIVIANPPYLKERGNSVIFEPVNESSIGQLYHQGKMDYWYYFLHLAMNLIKKDSVICFVTPSYWLNSSGAKKLITRIRKVLKFISVLNFENSKVFSTVEGYHMVSCYTNNKNVNELFYRNVRDLNHVNDIYPNEFLTVDVLNNKEIYQGDEIILRDNSSVKTKTINLGSIAQVSQGVIEASDKISSRMYKNNPDPNHKVGEGIFVLTKDELIKKGFNENENALLKDYYDGECIHNYYVNKGTKKIIYSDAKIRTLISSDVRFINIKKHLDSLSSYITSSNGPYGLHRPRKEEYFSVPKIIVPSMFGKNEFAFDDENGVVGMSYSIIFDSVQEYDLKYLLGVLNSSWALKWFYENGKHRGVGVDIGVDKLKTFPIPIASIETKNKIIDCVDSILNYGYDEEKQNAINKLVEDLYQ